MTGIYIVIGSNFGDEGKGLMTGYFADSMMERSGKCLVVLSNGGAQRGHTVVRNGIRHIFSHFGSGTFAGADTYFPREFIINPMIFMKECRNLIREVPAFGKIRIYIHPKCLVTTPFEMLTNLVLEEHRGEHRHGSVGAGIWETLIGEGKCFEELLSMDEEDIWDYLNENRRKRFEERIRQEGVEELSAQWREILESGDLKEQFIADFTAMKNLVQVADDRILRTYQDIIFENGQGLLLGDRMKWRGFGDHTTPSNTGIQNPARIIRDAYAGAEQEELKIEAVYVTRTYMTRHGAGRFDTECSLDQIDPTIRDMTNVTNESQGSLRYGKLNFQSLVKRIKRDFQDLWEYLDPEDRRLHVKYGIAMTHLNEYGCKYEHSKYVT